MIADFFVTRFSVESNQNILKDTASDFTTFWCKKDSDDLL